MWAQPWAWLGLAGLAVPVAIHLLARHQAVRAAFPTLRFIDASELNAIKRQRLTDIPLLLLRLLMIALAVAAIAGPRIGSTSVTSNEDPAHATVYDMTESAASGRSDSFIALSRRAHIGAESLSAGLDAASAWAVRQSGQREITIVSDFQRGSLDAAAVARVPSGIGLHFERVRSTPRPLATGLVIDGDTSRMVWPAQRPGLFGGILVKAGADQAAADAMLNAVVSVVPFDSNSEEASVLIVFEGAPERQGLVSSMVPIDQPWMFDVTRELLARQPTIARVGAWHPDPISAVLIVALDVAPGSVAAAEAVASIATGLSRRVSASESDPRTIDDATLKSWERAAENVAVERKGEPQGRWLWAGVLVLLAIETGMRRRAA